MKLYLQTVSGFNFLAIRAGMTGLLLTAAAAGAAYAMLTDSGNAQAFKLSEVKQWFNDRSTDQPRGSS